jgi:hypothetical protein
MNMNAVFDTGGEEGRCGRGHVGCYRKRWGEIVEEYTMLGTRDIATRLVRTNHLGNPGIRNYKRGRPLVNAIKEM